MDRMITWSERSYYSMVHDGYVARISGFDDRHQEHWMEIEKGKGYRERREVAVTQIMNAIEAGELPGKVKPEKE